MSDGKSHGNQLFVKRLAVFFQFFPRIIRSSGKRQFRIEFVMQHPDPYVTRVGVTKKLEFNL